MKNTTNEGFTMDGGGNSGPYTANWPERSQADRSASSFIDEMNRGAMTQGFSQYDAPAQRSLQAAAVTLSRRQFNDHIEAKLASRRPAAALPRVLHVDADADSALLLATLLVPETEVVHVSTRQAAIRLIREQRFDLIVLDPELADGDGAVVFEALKDVPSPTKVLLFSAHDTVWRDQASAFLVKPWTTPLQLWNTVSRLLGIAPAVWTGSASRKPAG
jgi:CheY-like chemotaxis protein